MISFMNFLLPIHMENLITNSLPVKWELNIWTLLAINVWNFYQERFIQPSSERNISQLAITLVGKESQDQKSKMPGKENYKLYYKIIVSWSSVSAKWEYHITLLGEASHIKHWPRFSFYKTLWESYTPLAKFSL